MKQFKLKRCISERKDLHIRCYGSVVLVSQEDKASVLRKYRDQKGIERVSSDFPIEPHESGLCYYHLKKKEGLFDKRYPLARRTTNESI